MQLATKFKPDADAPFQTAVDAGLRAAELWTGPDVLADCPAVIERARRFDLRYAVHFPTRRDLTDEQLRAFVELYRALDCRSATIHQPEYDLYGPTMQRLAPDVALGVENSRVDVAGFHRWAEENPRLTFDVEHVWFLTIPEATLDQVLEFVANFLTRHAAKIQHVHMPGYVPGTPDHRPMYTSPQFVLSSLNLLHGAGYRELVVSEVDVEFQTLVDLQKDRDLFDRWLQTKADFAKA